MKIGQEKQLEDTLQCLRGINADVTEEATEIRVRDQVQALLNEEDNNFADIEWRD